MADDGYDEEFYEELGSLAEHAAAEIVPLLLRLFTPSSVIDVGCGDGAFLHEFARHGVTDLHGVEGKHLPADFQFRSPVATLTLQDLEHPFEMDRRFDLALCLEVAEHLEYARSAGFVADLCKLADVVVFSAAVPGQGGTHHVNEQWPTFWRDQFARHGYGVHDVLRARLWTNPSVATWYKQNILIYARDGVVDDSRLDPAVQPLSVAHPDQYELLRDQLSSQTAHVQFLENTLLHVTSQRDYEQERSVELDRMRLDLDGELFRAKLALQENVGELQRLQAEGDALVGEHDLLLARLALASRPSEPVRLPAPDAATAPPPPQTIVQRLLHRLQRLLPGPRQPDPVPGVPAVDRTSLRPFDAAWYLAVNPDVAALGVDALEHYATVGWREGRDPHPLFDTDWYLVTNEDVVASGLNPLQHYATIGWRQHLDPHPLFDGGYYLTHNPDVAASGLSPLVHYVEHGWREGRNPHPLFDTNGYLAANEDVAAAGVNPLAHFVEHGVTEGRPPRPG